MSSTIALPSVLNADVAVQAQAQLRQQIQALPQGTPVVLDAAAVQAVRRNRFGVEALVLRDRVPRAFTLDRASMEDIMLFSIKEEKVS